MVICVVGTGYVGLVTGAVLAELGNDVVCVDKDVSKIDVLCDGRIPIYEPGLGEVVDRNVEAGRLMFSTDIDGCVSLADVVFIAVGTPAGSNGFADLSYVRQVAKSIARSLDGHKIIVNKSTVPVGTADEVRIIISADRPFTVADFDVVSNPEFLREGNAVYDAFHPDRVVIGSSNPDAAGTIASLYEPFGCPIMITDARSAEMIKYASNAFLATKISFINSVANVCEESGADVQQVALGMGMDKRIGAEFLNAGLGYGGSCFGKDAQCLVALADMLECDFQLLKSAIEVNSRQPQRFVERMKAELGSLRSKRIAVLGLAFKPDTDDLRDAKSMDVINHLIEEGADVCAYDPIAMPNARGIAPDIQYAEDAYDALQGSDAAAIVTEWSEFKDLDFRRIRQLMVQPYVFDGRNMFDPQEMLSKGFYYYCIGRPTLQGKSVRTSVESRIALGS